MFTLRCTKKLLKRLRVEYTGTSCAPTTRLGDWYAHIVTVDRRPIVLFVSEKSLLCVLVYAKDLSSLVPRFRNALGELLHQFGVAEIDIERENEAMTEILYGTTNSRSVLGSMNDFVNQIRAAAYYHPIRSLSEHQLALAEAPCGPLNYENPRDKTVSLLAAE